MGPLPCLTTQMLPVERVLYRSLISTGRLVESKLSQLRASARHRRRMEQIRDSWACPISSTHGIATAGHQGIQGTVREWFESGSPHDHDLGFTALRQLQSMLRRVEWSLEWTQIAESDSSPMLSGLVLIAV